MAKKKAFARYANNKIVPGSLIVREKAPKVGVWKEVIADLCCGSGTIRIASTAFSPSSNSIDIYFSLGIYTRSYNFRSFEYVGNTEEAWIEYFNQLYGWMGTFSINPENPNQVFFDIKTEVYNGMSDGQELSQFAIGPA